MAQINPSESAVSTEKLSFNYGQIKAVDELSFKIPCGVSFGLLGPNGAGKTTLIRLLVGLLKPKDGSISIMGKPATRETARCIGYMPQLHSLYNELSIWQNVDFFARIYGLENKPERQQRVEEIITVVDLWSRHSDPVHNLSGGMKQRVSLACAIVHRPPLLFLDEPTVGLDPMLRVTFWEYFDSLIREGHTLIISSHTMDDAAHCQHLGFMRQGKIIAEGSPQELRRQTGQADAHLEDAFLYFIRKEQKSA